MNAFGVLTYVIWTSLIVAASAWLLERAFASLRSSVRWVWLGALWSSVSLPAVALVRVAAGGPAAGLSGDAVAGPAASAGNAGTRDVGVLFEPGSAALQRLSGWWREPGEMIASGAGMLPALAVPPSTIVAWWLASSVMAALILGLSLLRLHRCARVWPETTLLGHSVKIAPGTGPATVGILTPGIVLPRWALSLPEPDLALILSHEAEHVRSRDTLLLSAGLVAVVVCPWNPVVWWQMRRLKAAVEVDCDRRVLRDGVPVSRYGALLLLVASESEPPVGADERVPVDGAAPGAAVRSDAVAADVVAIRVDRDGSVQVNGSSQPVDRIGEVTAPLAREGLTASIEAHRNVPYRVVAAVQQELRRANLLRVVFTSVTSEGERPAPRPSAVLVEGGLPVVLPDTSGRLVMPSGRNVLEVQVLPTEMLDLRRGESSAVERVARERCGVGSLAKLV